MLMCPAVVNELILLPPASVCSDMKNYAQGFPEIAAPARITNEWLGGKREVPVVRVCDLLTSQTFSNVEKQQKQQKT